MHNLNSHHLHQLFSTKAWLTDLELITKPIAQDDLEARAKQCDEAIAAMDEADKAIAYLDHLVTACAGTEHFARALEIAFEPTELDGLKRVAEYYRRAEVIEAL